MVQSQIMHLKQIACFLFLAVIILLAVLLARISHLIEIRHPTNDEVSSELHGKVSRHSAFTQPNAVIGDSPEHLFWFVQISDLHISMFHDPDRISDLRQFCDVAIDAIKPEVVLASGDLSDGKASDHMGSNQYVQEWQTYKRVLGETKVAEKTIWLDIRGNHDNFNVPGVKSERSYYHQFSVQGQKHIRSYMYSVRKGDEKYSFIGVDACLEPGPRRPFNFFGNVNQEQYNLLNSFEKESRESNGTIWFGHYPTSCIISPEPGIRQLMANGTAYLCGHLHTLGGMVPNMYTFQHSGLLELELGDWKDNRMYRVAAFDHGFFSFVDVVHDEWPVILVTNPKHALFTDPTKEPLELIKESSHIRILVYSPTSIQSVQVRLNEEDWVEAKHVEGPLFTAEWSPALYSTGLHSINVNATEINGKFREIHQPFSLDGTRISFELLPRIALMTNAQHLFHGFFITFVVGSVLPFILIRVLHILVKANKISKPDFNNTCLGNFVRRIWTLATIDTLCIPLVVYPIYLTVGPWFIGEVIEGHIGASFAWGTVVDWTVLPTSFTYFYGTFQLFWFHIPFVVILSFCVDARYQFLCGKNGSRPELFSTRHVICAVHLVAQTVFAYYFWLAYGTLALILGFMRTWSVIMAAYLWYISTTLSPADFVEARQIWGKFEDENYIQNGETLHSL